MKLIIASPKVSTKERRILEKELEDAAPSIKRHILSHDEQSRTLRARLSRSGGDNAPVFHLTLTVHLPDNPVVVQKSDLDLRSLVQKSVSALRNEIRSTMARIRKEHLRRRRAAAKESFASFVTAVGAEPPAAEPMDSSDPSTHPVFARLRPISGRMYAYAREHIRMAQLAGELPLNYLTATDAVDQAIIRIIETSSYGRMDAEELEKTLYKFVDEIIEEEARTRHPGDEEVISLDSAEHLEDYYAQGRPEEEQAEFYQPFESLRLSDVLADHHAVDPEAAMSDSEEHRLILRHLTSFSSKARSAFYLNLVDGFEPFEVAMMQGRTEEEVLADVAACRDALREALRPTRR